MLHFECNFTLENDFLGHQCFVNWEKIYKHRNAKVAEKVIMKSAPLGKNALYIMHIRSKVLRVYKGS